MRPNRLENEDRPAIPDAVSNHLRRLITVTGNCLDSLHHHVKTRISRGVSYHDNEALKASSEVMLAEFHKVQTWLWDRINEEHARAAAISEAEYAARQSRGPVQAGEAETGPVAISTDESAF